MKLLFAALMAALVIPTFALDGLEQWASKIWIRPLPPERDSVAVVLTREGPGAFKKTMAKTTCMMRPDGSYTRDYSSPDETSHSDFLQNGSLASITSDNASDKKIYIVTISPDRRRASFRTEATGKEPAVKNLPLKPNNLVMSEYVNLIRQAWKSGIRDGFAFKGLAPDGSMEIDMETRLVETKTPWSLSDKYEVPAEFKAAFPDSQNYVVADFNLGGIVSMIYKFHNYWIFKLAPSGLEYVGSFGGDPKKATFMFMAR
ncbi:MAG TPA: hypothetical protein VMV44_13660 [Rectinemataceae bacterium]|nr:hypothetical protein [Rectinemataceae bacterium]